MLAEEKPQNPEVASFIQGTLLRTVSSEEFSEEVKKEPRYILIGVFAGRKTYS